MQTTRLGQWCEEHDFSATEISDLSGLSLALVTRAMRGERHLSARSKVRVARALGVPVRELFDPIGAELVQATGAA